MKILQGERVPIKAWVDGVELEAEAEAQLRNVANLPCVGPHVAVMPDVHWGIGATVGSVIPTVGAIVPAAVGVDLGCGMMARRLNLTASDLPDNLFAMRTAIEIAVPHGRSNEGQAGDRGAWGETPDSILSAWNEEKSRWDRILQKHPKLNRGATHSQLGTLGSGNHFVEICLDESQNVWIMLHSGSRGLGNRVGSYFIARAKEEMLKNDVHLPDKDLAYLTQNTRNFDDYVDAVSFAQNFASLNRHIMMNNALSAVSKMFEGRELRLKQKDVGPYPELAVQCHHNYISREHHFGQNVWITRKGAVDAHEGVYGIIPGSMGAKSFIVRGNGNAESFMSCSHGAGRRMSRGKARKSITLEQHAEATAGVECRKDSSVLDESPAAYKSIDAVMAAQSELVDIVHTLKQVLCVKG